MKLETIDSIEQAKDFCLKNFKDGTNTKSSKFFRIFNEVPTILLILTVFVVIFRPL